MALLAAGGLVGPADAQTPAAGTCRALTDAAERLRCYDEEASFDLAAIIRRELECERPPRTAEVVTQLIRRNVVRSLAFHVAGDLNYFALAKPELVDGLPVVAVFGFDETGQFPFVRGHAGLPGPVFGIVTTAGQAELDRWRVRHSPALLVDDTASPTKGGTDIACVNLGLPALSRGSADESFEAGLGPKRP